MKKFGIVLSTLTVLTITSYAGVIFSTYDGINASTSYDRVYSTGDNADWYGQDIALSFTNTAQAIAIDAVTMRMTDTGGDSFGRITVSVNINDNGIPGASIGNLSYANSDAFENATFTGTGITIIPNAVYWIVADSPDGWTPEYEQGVRWYKGTSGTGYARRHDDSGTSYGWQDVQSATPAIMIIPEPASAMLILFAGGILYFKTRILGCKR